MQKKRENVVVAGVSTHTFFPVESSPCSMMLNTHTSLAKEMQKVENTIFKPKKK
jgi:hypothetical protein